MVLEEWFIGVCDAGMWDFGLRLGQVRGIAQVVYWVIGLVVNAISIVNFFCSSFSKGSPKVQVVTVEVQWTCQPTSSSICVMLVWSLGMFTLNGGVEF